MSNLSPTFVVLAAEWASLASLRGMDLVLVVSTRRDRKGRTIYIVRCANGYHESYNSHEEALRLLISAHTTRVEDTEAFYSPLVPAAGGNVKSARALARQLGTVTREANPLITDDDLDSLIRDAAQAKIAEHAADVLAAEQAAIAAAAAAAAAAAEAAANAPTPEELAAQAAENALRAQWWEEQRVIQEDAYQSWKASKLIEGPAL